MKKRSKNEETSAIWIIEHLNTKQYEWNGVCNMHSTTRTSVGNWIDRKKRRDYCFEWQTYRTVVQLVRLWKSIIIQNSHIFSRIWHFRPSTKNGLTPFIEKWRRHRKNARQESDSGVFTTTRNKKQTRKKRLKTKRMNNSDVRTNEETMAQLLPDPIDPSLSSINNNNQREMHYIVFLLRIDLWETYRISLCLLSSGDCCWWCWVCLCSSTVAIATETLVISSMMVNAWWWQRMWWRCQWKCYAPAQTICFVDHEIWNVLMARMTNGGTIALTMHSFFLLSVLPSIGFYFTSEMIDVCVVIMLCVCVCRSVLCIKSMGESERHKSKMVFGVDADGWTATDFLPVWKSLFFSSKQYRIRTADVAVVAAVERRGRRRRHISDDNRCAYANDIHFRR